jgi:hypothetical protein
VLAGVHDGLHRTGQAATLEQFHELLFQRHEMLAQGLAGRHDQRAFAIELGRRKGLLGRAQAEPELGVAEVDDIVGSDQARAGDALAVDEGAVGAVQVGQPQPARDVFADLGMAARQAERRDHELVARVATDPVRPLRHRMRDPRAVARHAFEIPAAFHCPAPIPGRPRWRPVGAQRNRMSTRFGTDQNNNPMPIISTDSTTELASGTCHSRPRHMKLKSPGSRPKPTLRSQCARPLNSTHAIRKTSSQRIVTAPRP